MKGMKAGLLGVDDRVDIGMKGIHNCIPILYLYTGWGTIAGNMTTLINHY